MSKYYALRQGLLSWIELPFHHGTVWTLWPCGGSNQMYGPMHIVRAPKQNISQCGICLIKGSLWNSLWVGQDVSILAPPSCVHRVDYDWKPEWIVTEVYFIHFIFIYSFFCSLLHFLLTITLWGKLGGEWMTGSRSHSKLPWQGGDLNMGLPDTGPGLFNNYAMLAYFLH